MSTPALLKGVQAMLVAAYPTFDVGIRPGNDGAPHGAYKRAKGWFFGIYFAGADGSCKESFQTTYAVGVDITRSIPNVKSAVRGTEYTEDDELNDVANQVAELLCGSQGKVAVACNAALAGSWQAGNGLFREHFVTYTMSAPTPKSPDWVLGVPKENQTDNPLVCVSLRFSGLKWHKSLPDLFSTTGKPT